jgi:hypothetical protein
MGSVAPVFSVLFFLMMLALGFGSEVSDILLLISSFIFGIKPLKMYSQVLNYGIGHRHVH